MRQHRYTFSVPFVPEPVIPIVPSGKVPEIVEKTASFSTLEANDTKSICNNDCVIVARKEQQTFSEKQEKDSRTKRMPTTTIKRTCETHNDLIPQSDMRVDLNCVYYG